MKHITIILFVYYSYLARGFGQAPSVQIIAKWQKGEEKHYDITKSTLVRENGAIKEFPSIPIRAHLKILDATPNHYEISWKPQYSELYKSLPVQIDITDALKKYFDLTFNYRVNNFGTFEQLLNHEEVETTYHQVVGALMKSDEFVNDKTGMGKGFISSIIGGSPNGIGNALTQEIRLLHTCFGATYTVGDTIAFDEELPFPGVTRAITSRSTVVLSHLDTVAGTCVIMYTSKPDAEALTTNTKAAMDKILAESNYSMEEKAKRKSDMDKALNSARMELVVQNNFHINYRQGWPTLIQTNRITIATDGSKAHITEQRIDIKLIN